MKKEKRVLQIADELEQLGYAEVAKKLREAVTSSKSQSNAGTNESGQTNEGGESGGSTDDGTGGGNGSNDPTKKPPFTPQP